MQVNIYNACVPVLTRHLKALANILDKAIKYCADKRIDQAAILNDRLFPDMLPFARQVRMSTDHAKGAAGRLAGITVPVFADDETTLEQLKDRVERAIAFIGSVDAKALSGADGREIVLKMHTGAEVRMDGGTYLLQRALPNFFFHVSTAYAILRHRGLEIGKSDFMGPAA